MSEEAPRPSADEMHKPFGVLLASRPPAQGGRARSSVASLVIHTMVGTALVWSTMALAEESEVEEEPIYVELVEEVQTIPPPPPPPPPVEAAPPPVLRGFQELVVPTLILPDIPPPSTEIEFRAMDFTGQGVTGGRGDGRELREGEAVPDPRMPGFTPMTVRPELANREEVTRALIREYPSLLRDAGIGGTVRVWLFIDVEGRVQTTQVQESSGHEALDLAALEVASVMRFTPALNREVRVPVWVDIPVTFQVR